MSAISLGWTLLMGISPVYFGGRGGQDSGRRICMSNVDSFRFVINVGSQHRLPLDSSSKQFEDTLKKVVSDGSISRKVMRNACADLPIEGAEGEAGLSLYDFLNQNRYESYDGNEKNTYRLPIYWEIQDLLAAICVARKKDRRLKGDALAKETLSILVENMKKHDPAELGKKYAELQLLKEEYVRAKLIQNYQEELQQRLDVVWMMTLEQPANVAVETMQIAFPALDALVVNLLQIDHPTEASEPLLALPCVQSYFERLMSVRPKIKKSKTDCTEEYEFSLEGHPQIIKNLQEKLEVLQNPRKEKPHHGTTLEKMPKNDRALQADVSAARDAFDQYLRVRSEITESEHIVSELTTFLKNYQALDCYFHKEASWEKVEFSVREELQTYIRNMFADLRVRNYVPYDYSEFQQGHVDSAFIAERCKNAHNQIRASLHAPLRLLMEIEYIQYFHPNITESDKYKKDLSQLLAKQLAAWLDNTEKVFKSLSDTYKAIPLLMNRPQSDVSKFVKNYNENVTQALQEGPAKEKMIMSFMQATGEDDTAIDRVLRMKVLLLLECQMIAVWHMEEAIQEIKTQYTMLHQTYKDLTERHKAQ